MVMLLACQKLVKRPIVEIENKSKIMNEIELFYLAILQEIKLQHKENCYCLCGGCHDSKLVTQNVVVRSIWEGFSVSTSSATDER